MKTVFNDATRPDADLLGRFDRLLDNYSPSCLVCDAQNRGGILSAEFRPVGRVKAAGPALTINLDPDNLVDCMPVLRKAQRGDFIIVGAQGTMTTAMWGGMMSGICKQIGIAGALIDGAIRDVDEIRDIEFAVWSRGVIPRASPTSLHGRFEPVQVNVPVVVGGRVINPGDIVVADENGVSVVAANEAHAVIERAEAQAAKENDIRDKVMSGVTVSEILDTYGHV